MQNRGIKTRRKYEKKLANAIQKAGGISLIHDKQEISAILIAEPKGLCFVDEGEVETIEAIIQATATGQIMAYNQEFGSIPFEFEFVGSKEECYKFLLEQKESDALQVAGLHIKINGNYEA